MKYTTTAFLAAILFTGSAAHGLTCPRPEAKTLVGLWESRETSKGGIGHTIEFREDGTFVEATTVMASFTYHVSGDRLTLDEAPGGSVKVRIEGDTFLQTQVDGSTLEKKRLGKAEEGSPAIVGAWRYRSELGSLAFERYTPDGRMSLRLPLAGSTGCYEIAGDRIAMTRPNEGKAATVPFELHAGELVLKGPGKSPVTYGLEPAGPWYDREHLTPL